MRLFTIRLLSHSIAGVVYRPRQTVEHVAGQTGRKTAGHPAKQMPRQTLVYAPRPMAERTA